MSYQTSGNIYHIVNNQFISILTPDAALYGYYAKLLLRDLPHTTDVHLIEYVLFFITKYSSFTLDQAIYYSPAFFSSLIIIPAMLISNLYIKIKKIVFLVGLTTGIGYGYYSRSYLGYFDTDILNTFFPMMILYGMLITIKKEDYKYSIIIITANVLFLAWYHSSEIIVYALNISFVLYSLIFYRTNADFYKISVLVMISIAKLFIIYKLFILLTLFLVFKYFKIKYKYFLIIYIIVFILAIYKIDFTQFIYHANRYLFKEEFLNQGNHFFLAPMQLVSEARSIDAVKLIKLMSGNIWIFILSIIGYIMLVSRHKEIILGLPLIVFGLLSFKTGIRFHIYTVSIFIISYAYLSYYLILKFKMKYLKSYLILLSFFTLAIYENYNFVKYINTKIAFPVFNSEQIVALNKLKNISNQNDSVVTWWDYGWPIWYYTNMNTLIDNGKHHADNYTVSKILMSNSQKFSNHASHYFYDLVNENYAETAILKALKLNKNSEDFFKEIENKKISIPIKTDKYLVLPYQITSLLHTISSFENIDIKNAKRLNPKYIYRFKKIGEDKNYIYLDNNTKYDKYKGVIVNKKSIIKIKQFLKITFKNNKKMLSKAIGHKNGFYFISIGDFYYIMDEYFFNSTIVQLLFLNNYDKEYFKPIFIGKTISIYKIK
ncbi:MAG: STT3 domain-containing protein [Campylobacterota bacterium]|nr:STT3 domain-containing protein [Campylobacterota bacterium]